MVWFKGAGSCCCDGCHVQPADRAVTYGDSRTDIQPMQQYCCSCIPREVCVTVATEDSSESRSVLFRRDCTAVPGRPVLYSGTVPFGGQDIDLEFLFVVVNRVCYLAVASVALGVNEDTPYLRQPVDSEESRCNICDGSRIKPYCATGRFEIHNYGVTTIVTLSAAANIALINRKPCLDSYGNAVDRTPLRNLCGGCACICDQVCIVTVQAGRVVKETATFDIDTATWTTPMGIVIGLVPNETTHCCELALLSTGYVTSLLPGTVTGNVPIGERTIANKCPRPTAEWRGEELTDLSIIATPVSIFWNCSGCMGCVVGMESFGCCGGTAPFVLRAVIEIIECDVCVGEIEMFLVWNKAQSKWEGARPYIGPSQDFCTREMSMSLTCGPYWTMAFIAGPCGEYTETIHSIECSPLYLVYGVPYEIVMTGADCCKVGAIDPYTSLPYPGSDTVKLRITIMEA